MKPKPEAAEIELPPEDVPFEEVVRKLLAAPPSHERRGKRHLKPQPSTESKGLK